MTEYEYDYLYDDDSKIEASKDSQDYYRASELDVIEVNHGTILPRIAPHKGKAECWMGHGGVVDDNWEFVDISGIKNLSYDDYVFGGSYDVNNTEVERIDDEVIYIGPLFFHWGHFITQFVTRLWFWKKHPEMKIAFCGWGFNEKELVGPYKRFFELMGIEKSDILDIRKPTSFRKIYVPEMCYLRKKYYTDYYREMLLGLYDRIDKSGLVPYEKVYYSRYEYIRGKKGAWRREHGEKIVAKIFAKNGFAVMEPSDLSLDQQIFYMRNCKVFACFASAAMDGAFFMEEQTDRILLKNSFEMHIDVGITSQCSNARHVTLIDSYYRPSRKYRRDHQHGPNMIGVTPCLKKYLKDHDMTGVTEAERVLHIIGSYIWLLNAITYDLIIPLSSKVYHRIRKVFCIT